MIGIDLIKAAREPARMLLRLGAANQAVAIGIGVFDLPHIFESFYRADKSRTADKGSTGLGLTIAQKIVQRHNGQIEVESHVDEGSTFRILLPIVSMQ